MNNIDFNPEKSNHNQSSRRFFLKSSVAGAAAIAFSQFGCASSQKLGKETPKIQGFEDHPNVEVVAVSDLIPERCAEMSKVCKCSKTYSSLEELVKDKTIEAVFVATDAPNHTKHCLEVLNQAVKPISTPESNVSRWNTNPRQLNSVLNGTQEEDCSYFLFAVAWVGITGFFNK